MEAVLISLEEDIPQGTEYVVSFAPIGEGGPALGRMDAKRAEELRKTMDGAPAHALQRCLEALEAGAEAAAVLDSATEHVLLLYLLDQPVPGMIISR